jgi:hypothetical protein
LRRISQIEMCRIALGPDACRFSIGGQDQDGTAVAGAHAGGRLGQRQVGCAGQHLGLHEFADWPLLRMR